MSYVRDLTIEPYKGIKRSDTKYIPTGFSCDYLTDDLMSRKLSIITGQAEEGKSVIVHRIMLNAIDKGHRVLLVDGEYHQEELIRELYLKIVGNDRTLYNTTTPNKVTIKEPKKHIQEMIERWHKDKLYIISKNECDFKKFEDIYDAIVDAVVKYKIDLIVLDNMMSLVESTQAERNAAQADFVKNIIQINRKHNCHSMIVNHPKKQAQRGIELDIFDMSGTSDMPNLIDNGFIVRRNFDPADDEPDGWLYLKKNKLNGKHAEIKLVYDDESRTYLESDGNNIYALRLNWRNEGKQGTICDDAPF